MKKKILVVLLAICVLTGVLSLGAFATPELTDEQILAQRRDIAEAHMRKMTAMIWRAEEDFEYTIASGDLAHPEDAEAGGKKVFKIKAGELYRGVPYSYAGSGLESFLDFCSEPDENGIRNVSGLSWEASSGNKTMFPRIGNDCSGALMHAYSQIGNSFALTVTKHMVESRGFIKVGDYTVDDPTINFETDKDCASNGEQTMYEAYAQLQKADAIVDYSAASGHTRMVVKVTVVRNTDGTINGSKSKITVLEQTSSNLTSTSESRRRYFDEALGEYVNVFCGVDVVYSFRTLYVDGYLPITIRELVDASAAATPYVTDTLSAQEWNGDTLLDGQIRTNYMIDTATMTITDSEGNVVQQGSASADRYRLEGVEDEANRYYYFEPIQFVTDKPSTIRGYINPDMLTPGNYHCKLELQLSKGAEVYTVRDFDFTVKQKDMTIDHAGAECPLCGAQDAQWEVMKGTLEISGVKHYYLTEDLDYTVEGTRRIYTIPKDAVACVDLNGYSLRSGLRCFVVDAGGTLNITGPDSSVVEGGNVGLHYGVALDVSGAVNIYGGTYKHTSDANPVICLRNLNAVVNMYGGIVDGTTDKKAPSILLSAGTFSMHGGKVISGDAGDYASGGNFYVGYVPEDSKAKLCKVYLYGGTVENGTAKTTGGNLYVENRGELYICNEAVISGGSATESHGGNVAVGSGGYVLMTGGTITGGTAASRGGNVYVRGGRFYMTDGLVEKGSAKNGGNIESYGSDSLAVISGGLVSEGNATSATNSRGGNLYAYGDASNGVGTVRVSGTADIYKGAAYDGGNICCYGGNVIINNGVVREGSAKYTGGNLYAQSSGSITIQGGVIQDGTAVNEGGNLNAKSGSVIVLKNSAEILNGKNTGTDKNAGSIHLIGEGTTMTMGADKNDTCSIRGGDASRMGSNMLVSSGAKFVMNGGSISDGKSCSYGRNVAVWDATMTMIGGSIVSPSSAQGSGIYVSGTSVLNLSGTAKVLGTNARRTGNIWVNKEAKLQVDNSFTGDASVFWADAVTSQGYGQTVPVERAACGDTTAESFTASGTYTGKLTHETAGADPLVLGVDGVLVVAGTQVIGQTNRWVANNAAAMADVKYGEYIKLYTDHALELTKNTYVDINGHTVSASGEGMLYGMNSGTGGGVTATCPVADYAGSYLAIANESVYNFYPMDMALSAVVLRPETAGVYYNVRYNCDPVVGNRISYRGVALSLAAMPTEQFENESHVLYTKLTGALSSGEETSCLVDNILTAQNADQNDANGKTPIYARPYVAIDKDGDGNADYTVVADQTDSGCYSMQDVLKTIDANWASFQPQQETLKNHYNQWKSWNINWDLELPNFTK